VAAEVEAHPVAGFLREIVATMVRRNDAGLSAHQLAVFLSCYLADGDITVREMAQEIGASKASITRSFDKLVERGLVARQSDPTDGRLVYVRRTKAGVDLLAEMSAIGQNLMQRSEAKAA